MSYILESFGAVSLPLYDPQIDVGTGGSSAGFTNLPGGGVFDALGSAQAPRLAGHLRCRGTLLADTPALLDSAYDALRVLRGRRDPLWRRRADNSRQWCLARLLEIKATRQAQHLRHLEVELDFMLLSPVWYGEEAQVVNATLDASPKTVLVENAGNAAINNAVITVTAAGSAITGVLVGVSGVSELQWVGSLSAGQSLVIDCGARSVKKNDIDAYAGLTLNSNHTIDDWLRLQPGITSVTVTRTGGGAASTVRFDYYDGWA